MPGEKLSSFCDIKNTIYISNIMLCYSVTVFDSLITHYPTWINLKAYLESDEGGHFRVNESNGLALIRYEKGVTNMSLPHSRWLRSVVWNTEGNYPVSIAPPKASTLPCPYQTPEEAVTDNAVFTEFLDGFMINCFRMKGDSHIHITSRSKLDASGTFYSSKTFRQLFLEAFLGKEGATMGELDKEFQERASMWFESNEEDLSTGYSFLVQHKENRIVTPVEVNRVVLIHKHVLSSTSGLIMTSGFTTFRGVPNGLRQFKQDEGAALPRSYLDAVSTTETKSLPSWIQRILETEPWSFQGVVCEDKQGNRWRFRSDKYLAVKTLRGNCPSVLERFSQLYVQNLVHKYLEFYPEDTIEFQLNLLAMNQVIQSIFVIYINLHVAKSITVDTIDKMYLPHLYNLHGIYISQLRPKKMKLVPMDIHTYFCKQPWQRIAFLIRKNKEAYFHATQ
jgi:hypothetical protein